MSTSARRGENLARLLGRKRAGEDSRADQEHVLLAEQADRIEHVLVAARLAERVRKLRLQPLRVRQRAEEARVDQRIDDVRIAAPGYRRAAAQRRGSARRSG